MKINTVLILSFAIYIFMLPNPYTGSIIADELTPYEPSATPIITVTPVPTVTQTATIVISPFPKKRLYLPLVIKSS